MNRPTVSRFPMLLAGLVLNASMSSPALATTYDMSPKESILLRDGKRFVVQNSTKSLALYRVADASVVREFRALSRIKQFALSPDETVLLAGCSDGSLTLWKLETGEQVWANPSERTGLRYVVDLCFSGDSARIAVCDMSSSLQLFATQNGSRVGTVSFSRLLKEETDVPRPPVTGSIMSAALSHDGRRGFLVGGYGENLHSFDLSGNRPAIIDIRASWPVRYSSDDKYVAFRNENSGTDERLVVVATDPNHSKHEYGEFAHIKNIRPTNNGTFQVTARVGRRSDDDSVAIGCEVHPGSGRMQEIWKFTLRGHGVNEKADFHPRSMIGISTDFDLTTWISDLRTGKTIQEIDNSASYEWEMVSTYTGPHPSISSSYSTIVIVAVSVIATIIVGVVVFNRKRRKSPRP